METKIPSLEQRKWMREVLSDWVVKYGQKAVEKEFRAVLRQQERKGSAK